MSMKMEACETLCISVRVFWALVKKKRITRNSVVVYLNVFLKVKLKIEKICFFNIKVSPILLLRE